MKAKVRIVELDLRCSDEYISGVLETVSKLFRSDDGANAEIEPEEDPADDDDAEDADGDSEGAEESDEDDGDTGDDLAAIREEEDEMSDALKFELMVGLEIPESPEDRIPMLTEMALGGECAAIVFDVMEGKAWKCWSPDCEPGSNTIADGWCEYFAEADRDEELEVYTRTGDRYGVAFESRATYRSYGMEVYPL